MLLTLAIILSVHVVLPDAQIMGARQRCTNEGEVVPAASINIPDIHCFTCMCTNSFVECTKEACPDITGCHMILPDPGCCQKVCKGCVWNGIKYLSGTEWRDPNNPCRVMHCKAGVITQSTEECYTPCRNPLPPAPGQCCGTCPGCRKHGNQLMDDNNVVLPDDPCTRCTCENGKTTCVKIACPVLHCPTSNTFKTPGECCPQCPGERHLMELPRGECMLGRDVHKPGSTFHPEHCTRCVCSNGTSICERTTCSIQESKVSCTIGGHTYQDGEMWKLDACKSCTCKEGLIRCAMAICPPCSPNHHAVREPGQCCHRCVQNDGVCTVFGDPHYRTFDGKFYSFQGSCKYQLAIDCVGRNFSIRVTNDGRSTTTSSWTKTVSIKVGELKVNLGQRKRVKVNGKRISPPYELNGKVTINKTDDIVTVKTHLGVSVEWNGNSFLQVVVPASYKGRMCGLCGNFNSNTRDDFTTRRGRLVHDVEKFGTSWRVGGKKACTRDVDEPQCQQPHLKRNYRHCEPLKSHPFTKCHGKVHYTPYFRACMMDMCECPTSRCHCAAFTAYAHDCLRLGMKLQDWRNITGCAGNRRRPPPPRLRLN